MSSLEKCLFRSSHWDTRARAHTHTHSYMNCLYILEMYPLSVASFANIYSHSVGCLFVLFRVSFAVQKLLRLMSCKVPFIFVFIVIALGGGSEKIFL